MLHRCEGRSGLHIVQHRVTMRERSALGVLARESYRDSLDEQRRERERLGLPPVDAALLDRLAPALELLHELRMRREPVGDAQQLVVQRAQTLGVDGGDDLAARCRGHLPLDGAGAERLLQRLVRRLQLRRHVADEFVRLLVRHNSFAREPLGELLAHGRVLGDRRGEQRLRVRGLVLLVVAVPAVADEIDDDVVAEALAVRHREADRRDRRLGIVGVHVDDRNVEAFRKVARVARRAAVRGIGGEADLVVRDDVQRAAGRVAGKTLEIQCLSNFALAGERSVTVDEHRQRDARVGVALARRAVGLLGARASFDNRVDGLEMARVRGNRDGNVARCSCTRSFSAEVVLHVAAAAFFASNDRVDRSLALELAQDRLVRAADDVREHVEAATVRHADDDFVRSGARGDLDRLVEHRHHHVEPLDRELLLAEKRAAQVLLHPLHLCQPLEQMQLLVVAERAAVAAGLDRLPQPHTLLVVGDVLDLVCDRPAVRLAEARQRIGERLAADEEAQRRGSDARLQLGRQLRDEPFRLERGIAGWLGAKRVEPRREVAVHAVGLHQSHCGSDTADEFLIWNDDRLGAFDDGGGSVPVEALQEQREPGLAREQFFGRAFEERAPFRRDGARVVEVLLEQERRVAGVESVDLRHATKGTPEGDLPERVPGHDGDRHAEEEARRCDDHGCERESVVPARHRRADHRDDDRRSD